MNCDDLKPLLGAHMDGELDLVSSMKAEEHLAQCAACQALLEKHAALGAAIAEHVPRYSAPERLRARVLAGISVSASASATQAPGAATISAKPARQKAPQSWAESIWENGALLHRWWAQAAVLAVVAIAAFCAGYTAQLPWAGAPVSVLATADPFGTAADEAASNHIRSLLATHLADVPSTDQHTVKPWFAGKLDYSPTVVDLAASGFPLTGGRLDVLQNRPVAALIYLRRKHIINLFVHPSTETPPQGKAAAATAENPAVTQRNGYNILAWQRNGMSFTAVSDLAEAELREFARLSAEQAPVPARP